MNVNTERDETLRYLREQHAAILKRVEHYTTPGHGAPGFVQQLQADLRGIEATMRSIVGSVDSTHANRKEKP